MVQTSYAAVLIATVALSAVSSTLASSFDGEQLQTRGMQRVRIAREVDDYELFARGGKGKKHHHKHHKAAGGAAAAGAMAAPAAEAASAPAPEAPAAREFDDEYELFARGGKGKKHHHKHHNKAAGGAAAMGAPAAEAASPDAAAPVAARSWGTLVEDGLKAGKAGIKYAKKHHLAHKAAEHAPGVVDALQQEQQMTSRDYTDEMLERSWGTLVEDGLKAGKAGIKYAKKHHFAQKAADHAPGVVDALQQQQQMTSRDYTDEMFERDFEEFLEARSRSRTHKSTLAPALGHGLLGLAQNYVDQKVQQNQMQGPQQQMREFDDQLEARSRSRTHTHKSTLAPALGHGLLGLAQNYVDQKVQQNQMQGQEQQMREFNEYDYFGRSYENMEELD